MGVKSCVGSIGSFEDSLLPAIRAAPDHCHQRWNERRSQQRVRRDPRVRGLQTARSQIGHLVVDLHDPST